jgi:UPF0042 nucleotide-binding protein
MINQNAKTLIVTGYSGAGISTTLKHLEDIGYEVFDNFPLSLASHLISDSRSNQSIAIGIDTRSRGFEGEALLNTAKSINAQLVFITAEPFILQKRFTETRRRHPLAKDRPVSSGIETEQEILEPIKPKSDFVIDTSDLSVHSLRHLLKSQFSEEENKHLTLSLTSFGFKFGPPREADIIMDVRFLQNPYWEASLRPLSGLDSAVGEYVQSDPHFDPFIKNFLNLLEPLIPLYKQEGKSYLNIGLGCTGGKHRSVFCVETIKKRLDDLNLNLHILHRDINH